MVVLNNNKLNKVVKKEIKKNLISKFTPDLIVGIESGGDLVGKIVHQTYNEHGKNIRYESIKFQRSTTNVKDKYLRNILEKVPKSILKMMRRLENFIYVSISKLKNNKIIFSETDSTGIKILLVDDAIDTGKTIVRARNNLIERYNNPNIKIFVVTQTSNSPLLLPDFKLYNELIVFPWSIDFQKMK